MVVPAPRKWDEDVEVLQQRVVFVHPILLGFAIMGKYFYILVKEWNDIWSRKGTV